MKTSKAQLRALLARGWQLQEEEKIRLARDIHDDISQKLTALSIELSLLQRRLGSAHAESAKINEVLELVSHINRSVRKTTNELRPKILDEFGLIAAIKFECQRLEKLNGGAIAFHSEVETVAFSETVAAEVFRVFQEAFARLATGTRIPKASVEIAMFQGDFCLSMSNTVDGSFANVSEDSNSLERLALEERLLKVKGKIQMQTASGRSQIVLKIPVS